jgi:hypothetical protein
VYTCRSIICKHMHNHVSVQFKWIWDQTALNLEVNALLGTSDMHAHRLCNSSTHIPTRNLTGGPPRQPPYWDPNSPHAPAGRTHPRGAGLGYSAGPGMGVHARIADPNVFMNSRVYDFYYNEDALSKNEVETPKFPKTRHLALASPCSAVRVVNCVLLLSLV